MKKYIIFIIITFSLCSILHGSDSIPLKRWEILYNQSDSLKQIKKKNNWAPISIPSKFRLPYKPQKSFQHVWLRTNIPIDRADKYYGISFGRIHYIYRIYINGHLTWDKTQEEMGNMHFPVSYKLPESILKNGKNELYIYLGIYGLEYGGLPDGVTIQTRPEFHKLKNWYDFLYHFLPLGITILMFLGIIWALMIYFIERNEKFFLYSSLLLLLYAIDIISVFSPYNPVNVDLTISLLSVVGSLMGILSILIIESLYRAKLHRYNRYIFPVIILSSVIPLFFSL